MTTPPPWTGGPRLDDDVSSGCEVAVVGAGIAGCLLARDLADAGVDVVVLEAAPHIGEGGSGPGLGHAFLGLAEPAFRLVHAVGIETAREIHGLTRDGLARLGKALDIQPAGGVWAPLDGQDPAALDANADALQRLGVTAQRWEPEDVHAATGVRPPGPALFLPDELAFDPVDALARLARAARRAGARIRCSARVTGIDDDGDAVTLHLGARRVRAEAVALTCGVALPPGVGVPADVLTTWREHACALPSAAAAPRLPLRDGIGYTTLQPAPGPRSVLRGARWASPHLETGETTPHTRPAIQEALDRLATGLLPAAGPASHRWAWIETGTCDGLPLVGPVPGRPRLSLCTGFGGNRWGLAPRAAQAVAEGLLTGQAPGIPRPFLPSRMI